VGSSLYLFLSLSWCDMTQIVTRASKVLRDEGMIIFFQKALAYIKLEPLILPYAFLKIKKLSPNSLDDLVDFSFDGAAGLIRPLQVRNEISELLRILDEMKPKVVIEVGTAGGGTLFLFCHIATEDATIISIDFPDRRFGGGYPRWKIPLYKAFSLPEQKLYLLRADSHSQETLGKIKNILDGRKVDFVFIDGDHTYEGVKRDFEMYSPLLSSSGLLAFHDIVVHPEEVGCEVSKFWGEVTASTKYKHTLIVNDPKQTSCGIGILTEEKQ